MRLAIACHSSCYPRLLTPGRFPTRGEGCSRISGWCVALILWLTASCVWAVGESKPTTAATRYQALAKTSQQAQIDYKKALHAAKTDVERAQVRKALGESANTARYAPQFLAVVREYPQDPAALDALVWMLQSVPTRPETADAVDMLLPIWINDARMETVCKSLGYRPCPVGDKLLRAALEKNSNRNVQAVACFALGVSLRKQADRTADASARRPLEREAEQLLDRVVARYGDVKQALTLGQQAAAELYVLRNLAVGKTAPNIEGEGVDGRTMKLAEYRGKVVLLVFWASWCGPCMADVPHEREITERYKRQPFAIVGVSGDNDREAAQGAIDKHKMTWRSFWDRDGSHGPIPTRWNIHSWPTVYLIDSRGVIRYKGDYLRTRTGAKNNTSHPTYVLDEALETLMHELTGKRT